MRIEIKELKEYTNVIIYGAAILMIISIVTPHASHWVKPEQSHVFWIWGLISEVDWLGSPLGWREDISFHLNSNPIVLSVGLIITLALFYITIKNILIARTFRQEEEEEYTPPLYHIFIYGILPIILMVFWMFFIQAIYSEIGFLENYNFWGYFSPNFGIYGFIIGSSICTVGHILQKYL